MVESDLMEGAGGPVEFQNGNVVQERKEGGRRR